MISQKETIHQAKSAISQLVSVSLCDSQNFPSIHSLADGATEITVKEANSLSVALKNLPYKHVYGTLDKAGAYHIKMLDGSLIQMLYTFKGQELCSHRLAIFPSPDLETYQRNSDAYTKDDLFADIVARSVVPFPIRFDFNNSPHSHKEIDHPKSHLTLGQYTNCRIPVSAPLTPFEFISFVIRNFYNTSTRNFLDSLSLSGGPCFEETIADSECQIPHFRLRLLNTSMKKAVAQRKQRGRR